MCSRSETPQSEPPRGKLFHLFIVPDDEAPEFDDAPHIDSPDARLDFPFTTNSPGKSNKTWSLLQIIRTYRDSTCKTTRGDSQIKWRTRLDDTNLGQEDQEDKGDLINMSDRQPSNCVPRPSEMKLGRGYHVGDD